MYSADELLQHIDDHTLPIVIGFTTSMIFQTIWLVSAARVAKRDQLYSIPMFCTFFWFAHDLGCALRFHRWFDTYDHWFMKIFWVGLLSAVFLELFFIAQIVKYGRKEVAPTLTQQQWTWAVVACAIGWVLAWEYIRFFTEEPLYFGGTPLSMFVYLFFATGMYLRRRGSAGQTVLMWQAFVGIVVAWWVTVGIWFTAEFRSWQYISLGVVSTIGGVFMWRVVARDKARPRTTSPVAAPERGVLAGSPAA